MNNEMPPKVQCGEHPFVGFANGLSAHRGWRVLRHEHWICTVKFKNVDDILELYSADPVFMPEYAPPSVGREAVRKAYEWVFATLNLRGHFIVHEAEVLGDTAWVRTNSTGRFTVMATGVES